jgi:hypothetical protein
MLKLQMFTELSYFSRDRCEVDRPINVRPGAKPGVVVSTRRSVSEHGKMGSLTGQNLFELDERMAVRPQPSVVSARCHK